MFLNKPLDEYCSLIGSLFHHQPSYITCTSIGTFWVLFMCTCSQGWISPSTSAVEKSEPTGCKDKVDDAVAEEPDGKTAG